MPRLEGWLGEGEGPQVVGAQQPLKTKKKTNSKKVTVPYSHSKTRFSDGRKLSLLSHNKEMALPKSCAWYRYKT